MDELLKELLKEVNITQPFKVVLTWFVQSHDKSPDNYSVTMKLIQSNTTPPKTQKTIVKDLHRLLPLPFTLPGTLQSHTKTDTYKYIVVGSRSYSDDDDNDNDNKPSFKVIHDGKVVNYKTDDNDAQEDDDDEKNNEKNILKLVKLGVLQEVNKKDDKTVAKSISGIDYMLVPHDTPEGPEG